MFDSSYITKSGQLWKLLVGLALILLAGVPLLIGLSRLAGNGIVIVAAAAGVIILATGSLIFAVRCPKCRAKLFLRAMSKEAHDRWLFALLGAKKCPNCNADR